MYNKAFSLFACSKSDIFLSLYTKSISITPVYGKEKFITRSTMRSDSTNEERICNPLKIYDINMDYLGKKYYTQIKEIAKHCLERLLYIFVNTNHEELDEIYEGDEIMEAVKEKLYNLESELDRRSAKRLYSSGIPLETIIECSSLSSKESKLLKKDLGI